MRFFSGLGLGLSLFFGFLILAVIAELYYLLWWKKRNNRSRGIEDGYNNLVKESTHFFFCWRRSSSLHPTASANQDSAKGTEVNSNGDLESGSGSSKDLLLKAFGGEEGVEAELMRLHNLAGPPRFLYTIKEESKEDLEYSDDGRSRKGSRHGSYMSDLVFTTDTPIPSPLASPMAKNSYNPFFESSTEYEINMLRSSPPPKFKFLRDAEEKLLKKLMEEAEKRLQINTDSGNSGNSGPKVAAAEVTQGSFLKFITGKNNEPLQYFPHHPPPGSSQVLPLDC